MNPYHGNLVFNFQDLGNWLWGGTKYSARPARPENYFESKQIYFSVSVDKALNLPEFQAK